ncbi:AraD1 family protein [Schlesneria paludicola]|uniref:AraD1 family protein n=1 Tax=Schlesneria paludicola TaxID=360056 RepID=UPI00029B2C8E|nr:AraD1 family protein [Schlesneria paludicola]
MRLVQFVLPHLGRRVGVVRDQVVIDLTSTLPECRTVYDLFQRSVSLNQKLAATIEELLDRDISSQYSYAQLLSEVPGGTEPYLLPPLDHPEPSRLMISGTGLSHLGSVQSRDQMHGGTQNEVPQTDSARMFEMGLKGGRPAQDQRGVAPEWFYKGDGFNLRGPQATLEIPAFALDGGEEPEIVGCYIIDPQGQPRRLGFVLGNEWSDHATETINYLYLAPSKLRTCSVGPSLQVTDEFSDVALRCTVSRNGQTIYDSGELRSGENHMCHSLRNMEDHHFKYPEHRRPGDLHLHFFGTSRLSFNSRDWKYQAGDVIRIQAPGFCEPLVNVVAAGPHDVPAPFVIESA